MSILFPLYAIGVLAISLPLIFHLIQRRPKGQQPFSSVMFLSPSPPRMAKRSRLDNLLLLILRGLALLLLAAAFTRPFFRSLLDRTLDAPARRTVLLVDASASMQRDGLWQAAIEEAEAVIDDVRPTDRVAVAVFDDRLTTLFGFDAAAEVPAARRAAALRSALSEAQPGWGASNLGGALTTASDMLLTAAEGREEEGSLPPQIVVVTDLQSGSELNDLDQYEWPQDVQVDVRVVRSPQPTNASLGLLSEAESDADGPASLPVRVRNADESTGDQFRLGWANSDGRLLDEKEYPVNVPPGTSRVVRVQPPPAGADRLMLIGDNHEFDNVLYVARQVVRQRRVLYVSGPNEPARGLLYYLQQAPLDNAWQKINVESVPASAPLPIKQLDPEDTPLVVLAAAVSPNVANALRKSYVKRGGRVLAVLTQSTLTAPEMAEGLGALLDLPTLQIAETATSDYSMLESIDFEHPLFQPFAEPGFNDFTKIRFWKHCRLTADEEVTWDVLAHFDSDRSPAIVQQRFGPGCCWVLCSGWQPTESQLALSTKFVPLLSGLLDPTGGRPPLAAGYQVNSVVDLPTKLGILNADREERKPPAESSDEASANDEPSSESQAAKPESGDLDTPATDSKARPMETSPAGRVAIRILQPDGNVVALRSGERFDGATVPGIYELQMGGRNQRFAVNLATRESRTTPLDEGQLEQRGVRTGEAKTMDEIQSQRRQLRDTELEDRQKFWKWLVLGAIGCVFLETALAGWLSLRRTSQSSPASASPDAE